MKRAMTRLRTLLPHGERGITGVETAVLLSAITVASSVFGLTYLRASMSASDQLQTGVMRLLGSGEGSLLAPLEMLAESGGEMDLQPTREGLGSVTRNLVPLIDFTNPCELP